MGTWRARWTRKHRGEMVAEALRKLPRGLCTVQGGGGTSKKFMSETISPSREKAQVKAKIEHLSQNWEDKWHLHSNLLLREPLWVILTLSWGWQAFEGLFPWLQRPTRPRPRGDS